MAKNIYQICEQLISLSEELKVTEDELDRRSIIDQYSFNFKLMKEEVEKEKKRAQLRFLKKVS